ncbi:hypothetical protein [Ulvibacter antarcticus]|uniref:Uncharacterized protein n=1 Tax=Ulvibacter antarcticus TaxID=442714 RepID=A0A3L9YD85_9FLAO|nr:hypothetical protein [Ulvibacter antarcticus]RMA58683.1 hypothetical protein BXY75_2058 [Ulvibacter antarcticus]
MKTINSIWLYALCLCLPYVSIAQEVSYNNDNFTINSVTVEHLSEHSVTVWTIKVKGEAGKTTPKPKGQMNGAPVLGYVFPTNLKSEDVGFNSVDGIVALALTSHPDFDDTPLWDENIDSVYDNDGIIWHPHWVVLEKNEAVSGGLAVKQFNEGDSSVVLPPTNPGMPMYMDSPGYAVNTNANKITVLIPDYRIKNKIAFNYDGVAAFMKVNTSDMELPMLGVYEVFSVASGDLSLPYTVKQN